MARIALTLCAAVLAGCGGGIRTVEVKVPVYQKMEPPAELAGSVAPPARVFTAPGNASVACLDPAGRDALVSYVDALRQRVAAWNAWAAP